jgi:hypothetical protein
MNTDKILLEAQTQPSCLGDVTTRFSFKGWADENCHNPKKNGEYLCLVKWSNSSDYHYAVLEYDRKTKWQVTDSCEHILWSELPPSPFS